MIQSGGEGPDSVAVPGSVAGLFELSSRFGRMPFADLVRPAQVLAEGGHRVSAREANAIRSAWPKLKRSALARQRYGTAAGQPISAGTWLKLPELAATLSVLQAEGVKGFYSGAIGASIVNVLGSSPQLSREDLLAYRAVWRRPLVVPYRDVNVTIMPPPSAGGAALAESLAMLGLYDPRTLPRGSAAHAHVLLEIMRRAQADRIHRVADPDAWSDSERATHLASFVDPNRWLLRLPIDSQHATANAQVVSEDGLAMEPEHTTHLAVIDRNGMAVSLTTTLSSGFGSKLVTDTGIVLNNAVGSFSGLGENQPLPNRRTTSSMAPTMVEDAQGLRLVLGTPGGDTIPSTLLQLVNSLVDYAVPIDLAVDAPRLHQGVGRRADVRMEGNRPISADLRRGLTKLGHKFDQPTGAMGHANTIGIIAGVFYGYVDPREGGLALGPH